MSGPEPCREAHVPSDAGGLMLLGAGLVVHQLTLAWLQHLPPSVSGWLAPLPGLWLLACALHWIRWRPPRLVGLRGGLRAPLAASVGCLLAAALLLYAVVGPTPEAAAPDPRPQALFSRIIVVLLAPLAEELYFRGLLLDRLIPAAGRLGAALLCGGLFGLLHLPQGLWLPMTALGLILSAVALDTRTALWPAGLHLWWNGLAVVHRLPLGPERLLLAIVASGAMAALIAVGLVTREDTPAAHASGPTD